MIAVVTTSLHHARQRLLRDYGATMSGTSKGRIPGFGDFEIFVTEERLSGVKGITKVIPVTFPEMRGPDYVKLRDMQMVAEYRMKLDAEPAHETPAIGA